MTDLQAALATLALQRNGIINAIVRDTASAFGIEPEAILSRDRHKSVSEARALVCFVARRCTRMSFPEIARALNLDQSSVNYAVKRVEALRVRDEWFASAATVLLESFGKIEEEERTQ